MAAYTVNTTPQQETLLGNLVPVVNAERNLRGLPALTNAEFIQNQAIRGVLDTAQQIRGDIRERLFGALDTATPSQLNQIKTVLGL